MKACVHVDVLSLSVSTMLLRDFGPDTVPEKIAVYAGEQGEPSVTVNLFGPVLGSMDSTDVIPEITCTEGGLEVATTVTRSATFKDSAARNVPWRPQISIHASLRNEHVAFRAVWRMRLSTGEEIARARTPPYPEQNYPIIVIRTLAKAARR